MWKLSTFLFQLWNSPTILEAPRFNHYMLPSEKSLASASYSAKLSNMGLCLIQMGVKAMFPTSSLSLNILVMPFYGCNRAKNIQKNQKNVFQSVRTPTLAGPCSAKQICQLCVEFCNLKQTFCFCIDILRQLIWAPHILPSCIAGAVVTPLNWSHDHVIVSFKVLHINDYLHLLHQDGFYGAVSCP